MFHGGCSTPTAHRTVAGTGDGSIPRNAGKPHAHASPEASDLYAIVFAGVASALMRFGVRGAWPLQWIGAGMTLHGALYFVAHDGMVQRLHPAVQGRDGCMSFGFPVGTVSPTSQTPAAGRADAPRRSASHRGRRGLIRTGQTGRRQSWGARDRGGNARESSATTPPRATNRSLSHRDVAAR